MFAAVKLLVPFSKPNGPYVNFWFTLDYRRQAQCSTFVFVASAVHHSELKTIQSITWEHIFQTKRPYLRSGVDFFKNSKA